MWNSRAALLVISACFWMCPSAAHAQAKSCCNMQTGEFLSIPKAECDAKPGHISYPPAKPEDAMKAMVCFQGASQQAGEQLQQYGINIPGVTSPAFPGVEPGETPTEADIRGMVDDLLSPQTVAAPEFLCCNSNTGEFSDLMSEDLCLAEGSAFFPDTPEYLTETQVCRGGPGGGGAWEDENYEDNIENGGMENWRDQNRPNSFTTFAPAAELTAGKDIQFQVAFKDPDAHTGDFSLRLKNADIMPQLPPEATGAITSILGSPNVMMPAGVTTCKEPCPMERENPNVGNSQAAAVNVFGSLDSKDIKSHVCGAYKGYIGAADGLNISVSVFKGSDVSGQASRTFTRNAADWVKFAIPIITPPGQSLPERGKVGISARFESRLGIMMGWSASPLSEAKVDSLHFCEPMGITAFHPKVIALNTTTKVPDDEEDSLGVQTFVNLDNDDADDKYDHEDDRVEGDNELVRLKLFLPKDSWGDARLNASQYGSDLYKLWSDADKSKEFEDVNEDFEVAKLLTETSADGAFIQREIWVEALKPSKKPGDIEFEFLFTNSRTNDGDFDDKIVFTALSIEDIEFKGKQNSVDDDDTLDEDPNFDFYGDEKLFRVFPGKRWAGSKPEDEPRNIVDVEVTLNVKPTRPVPLYFRALDVDDPSAWGDIVDTLMEEEDNRGTEPNFWGGFTETDKEHLELEFDDITKSFEFQVTMQPGDNFRIVGGGDLSTLMTLENDDGNIPEYTLENLLWIFDPDVMKASDDPDASRIPEHDNYVSDVLTVWRKLYIELDTMAAVTDNEKLEAKILRVNPASDHQITDADGNVTSTFPQQTVIIDKNLYGELPPESQSGRSGYENNFSPGKLTVNGVNYNVTASTAYGSGGDRITIARLPGKPELVVEDWGKTVFLEDDDTLEDGDPLPTMDMSLMVEAYEPAYILPIWDSSVVPNATKEIPFMLHMKSDQTPYLRQVIRKGFDGWVYHDEPDFWLVYLLHAYQGKLDEDGDGEAGVSGLSGIADSVSCDGDNGFGAIIYYESGRETGRNYASAGVGTGWQLKDVPVHEIAHLFSGIHGDGGMMGYDEVKSNEFKPVTLHKMRSCKFP